MKHQHVLHPKELISTEIGVLDRFNKWLAVRITQSVGTMYCAYLFTVIAITGGVAIVTNNLFLTLIVNLISQTFIQLVLLPIIMVGQNVQQEATEAKQETDHKALTYLAQIQDEQLEILKRLDEKTSQKNKRKV